MEKMISELKGIRTAAIAGHVRPDGDCVGACMGLYLYLKENYPEIETDIYLEEPKESLLFLQGTQNIQTSYTEEKSYDVFFVLDTSVKNRMGVALKAFESAKKTICIDHHISNKGFADVNVIDPNASSASELLYTLLEKEKVTKPVAEALYTGIANDTGVFQYSCTSSSTMNMAGMLMDKGIDFTKIVDEAFNQKTYNQNRAMGQALLSSRLRLGGRVVTSFLTLEEMHALEVLPKHMEGIVEQMRNTKDVELAVFLYENEDHTFKVSFRVNGAFDAASLAMHFGGGGHVKAAGCTVEGPAEEAIERILAEVEKRL